MHKIYLIHTSVSCESEAKKLADDLIGQAICACVQMIGPGLSTYRWHGKLEQAQEYFFRIKTTGACKDQVINWLHIHHPYDLPEISWTVHECSEEYALWVDAETK